MENTLINLSGAGLLLALQFATLCRVTHVARGWLLTVGGFLLYVAVNGAFLWGCAVAGLSPLGQHQLGCFVLLVSLVALTAALSRDDRWRTLFIALDYVAYLTAILPVCHVFSFRKLSAGGGCVCSFVFLIVAHAVFVFLLLPLVPRVNDHRPWRIGCIVAFVLFVLLYAIGIWPHSLVTGGWREGAAFLLASVVAWVVFPMLYAGLRAYLRTQRIERSLVMMTSEVVTRRAAIDAARRQRHDARHHRIALAEYLLRGQVDKALAYLEQLDEEAAETPTDRFVWCENDTINAILSGLSRKAAAMGVVFEVTANVERTVNLPDVDIVAVIANLVENAIEAAGGEVAADSRRGVKVTVALRQRERTVGMTVTNPVPEGFALSEGGLPCAEPGVGLESVLRVIERHHGELVYTLKDDVLECQALLKINESPVT